ncbi:MAG: HU family DNA-binding protein [Desulfovibrio sp.]
MARTLTKADIAEAIYEHSFAYDRSQLKDIVEDMLAFMKQGNKDDDGLLLSGSGKFDACGKEARQDRGPRTTESMTLPPRKVVVFMPSRRFREELNGAAAA